jgi:high-affinity iron transporter
MAELLITLRETLEAALIIGILFTFISKTGKDYLKSSVLGGLTSAIIASIVFAIFFQMVLGGFSGKAEAIFEGIVMIVAAALLSSMIIWMARNKNVSESLENQASAVLENKKNAAKGMFLLAFVSVFREGIETVLFLYGILIKDNSLSIVSSLAGILIAIVIGYLIFIQGKRVPLKTFFNVTSILLIFVAAGLVSYGIHEFEEANIIPYYGAIWDINHLLNEKSTLGAFAKGLFG